MRKAWGVALAAVLAGAVACGSDSGEATGPGAASVGLSPPGTPLAAGLVVPVGTQLVGPVFPRAPHVTVTLHAAFEVTSHAAVLQVDGDPFAAWDDLAGQARAIGVPVPGSGVCLWRITSAEVMRANPGTSPETPVSAARPDVADAVDCFAAARGPLSDGTQVIVEMGLWWWPAGAELHVEVSEGALSEGDVDVYPSSYPETDPGPAPATAADQLPERNPTVSVGTGDPFGEQNNCFELGYDRLTVPAGARLIGGGTTPGLVGFARDFAAVLAVDDPEAVLGELRDQLDEPDSTDGDYRLGEERIADGTSVWSLSGGVSAGGGGCYMWGTPDGTAVLVTTSSD
ncbi:hypothetical protein [Trujillonella endophytica]|uniref:Uncharacterized protein n=1 Tax=Trujillonella endophytica TaxID=673521 RepID=A0A1H8VI75_9ACTN|nr:hypothetical protein [Trujillella endophytica]SEP15071.1 hypothetical protein SAMN05660991_03562 [Trujillella endophytica]